MGFAICFQPTVLNSSNIDGGVGYQVKVETGHEFEDWLEDDKNLDLWDHLKEYSSPSLLGPPGRSAQIRILILMYISKKLAAC